MENRRDPVYDISVIMPCMDEENTVGICVTQAKQMLSDKGLNGEILVIDNGSSDRSAEIAASCGAKVIREESKGYGNAIRRGLDEAAGRIILIGDCDTTYDFYEGYDICKMLDNEGFDMVIGDRFMKEIPGDAMSLSHRLGGRFLSMLGRMRFHTDVHDFHCGLRGLTYEACRKLDLHTTGMEFATEMIARAAGQGLSIGQIPVSLARCELPRKSKLRTLRDGARHLLYIVFKR